MGYVLSIGEYKSYVSDVGLQNGTVSVRLENAPADYGHCNEIKVSYTAWDIFTTASGLERLFNGENGLLIKNGNDGDFVDLSKEHQRIINHAYANIDKLSEDHQCALTWLKFWVDWAIENCQKPVFVNN